MHKRKPHHSWSRNTLSAARPSPRWGVSRECWDKRLSVVGTASHRMCTLSGSYKEKSGCHRSSVNPPDFCQKNKCDALLYLFLSCCFSHSHFCPLEHWHILVKEVNSHWVCHKRARKIQSGFVERHWGWNRVFKHCWTQSLIQNPILTLHSDH